MIKLRLPGDYCDNCCEFEPDVEKSELSRDVKIIEHNTIIRCVHSMRCRAIEDMIKRKYEARVDSSWEEKKNDGMKGRAD